MIENCCDIFEVFDEKNNLIKEYKYWKVLVNNRLRTLGECVIITKEHHENLSDLKVEEMAEFSQVVKELERVIKNTFDCDKFNYLMMMMKEKHTHFKICPRYQTDRDFAGMKWLGSFEPNFLNLPKVEITQEILNQIKKEIIKFI